MQTISEKIHSYINALSTDEVLNFYKLNFGMEEVLPSSSDLYRSSLFDLIAKDYQRIKNGLLIHQDEAYIELINYDSIKYVLIILLDDFVNSKTDEDLIEMFKNYFNNTIQLDEEDLIKKIRNINEVNPKIEKALYFYDLYNRLKYNKSDEIINKFNEIGLRNTYLNHFVEFERIENVMYDIIKSGVFVNLTLLICIIDIAYTERIAREIFENFIELQYKETYEKRFKVPILEIDIINMLRRNNKPSPNPRAKKIDELLFIKEIQDVRNKIIENNLEYEYSFTEPIVDVLNFRHSGILRGLLMELLKPVVELIGRHKTLSLFKPFFYILFEDNYNGLLTEDGFERENLNNIDFNGTYRGIYNSYFSTRVETLAGI